MLRWSALAEPTGTRVEEEAVMGGIENRRHFLASASLAAAVSVLDIRAPLADEGAPETTTIRLASTTGICFAPLDVAEEFLRAEGFTNIQYVKAAGGFSTPQMMAKGEVDFAASFAGTIVYHLDAGLPIVALSGLHAGCYELFAHEPIRSIGDLKGRRVGIQTLDSSGHLYLTIMAKHVGLDPKQDIEWVVPPSGDAMELFADGKTDAFLGFPPEPQELRARKMGRVILRTVADQPWSQYFCCMLYGSRAWVRDHPVATKRFLRATFKAAEFCSAAPAIAARRLVDGGFTERYDYALQTVQELPYDLWHEYNSEDSMRFYALRLREVEMIKANPNAILAEGTDWRFLNELKRELKG
jgi:NitT/TauT family transport system substrate-binding protein